MECRATLIGDVVGSRVVADRAALHAALTAAIEVANRTCAPTTPLRITVGDEYQGAFATVGAAIRAALVLRLSLNPDVDVRHGIGWGEIGVLQEEPRVEDGAGWWSARAAIEHVEAAQRIRATRALRTAYRSADGVAGPDAAGVNAALLGRDLLLSDVGARGLSVLHGMLDGMSQLEIAQRVGISPSAVSQRIRGGLESVLAVEELLEASA